MSRSQLRRTLAQYFTLSELRDIAFDLNIDFEELEGARKSEKALSLIIYVEQRGQLKQLLEICAYERPRVEWPLLETLTEELATDPPVSLEETLDFIRRGLDRIPLSIFLWIPHDGSNEPVRQKQTQITARLTNQFRITRLSVYEEAALPTESERWRLAADYDVWIVFELSDGIAQSLASLRGSRFSHKLLLLSPEASKTETDALCVYNR